MKRKIEPLVKEIPRTRSKIDHRADKKDLGRCPLCGAAISHNARKTRRVRQCAECGGTLNKEITCPHCLTQRVWTGKRGCVCHGCGRNVPRKAAN